MTQVLERSDNTGMIFVEKKLGRDKFLSYLKNFGFGSPTNIDLQEEASPKLKSYWSETDLATASFGQGIAVTGIQMLTAVATIANGGNLVEPHVVAAVENEDKDIAIEPKIVRRVISPATAKTVTDMMVNAALHGEAKWAVLKDYDVAGKTGTAQVPIEGHYDADKTVASFVGFAPAYDPKFVMIVTLTQPQTSQWAAETAAPLWFQLASDILLYLNVPPKSQ
jgi:cell division protein FtsI (penicillin-binding protein 3)/stage V sporulation protein D (sporulation-specific penicillin-binding protein)